MAALDENEHGNEINRWLKFIEHGATVTLLKVPTDVSAYKMFETLNDRGLKTSQADLVKNYLFGQSDTRIKEAQNKWTFLKGALELLDDNDVTVTFLRHVLIAQQRFVREGEVYEVVQATARGPQQSVNFLNTLEQLSRIYVAIFNPEHERWNDFPDKMRRAIHTLNLLDIRPLRPLMLALADKFSNSEALAAFSSLIPWGVRLMVAGNTRGGTVEFAFANAAKKVTTLDIENTDQLKSELLSVIPSDEQFRLAFETANVAKAKLARYYLRSLELEAKMEPDPWFIPNDDRETINLEHILPRKPENNWPLFNDEVVRAYVNRLGNQALLLARQNPMLEMLGLNPRK